VQTKPDDWLYVRKSSFEEELGRALPLQNEYQEMKIPKKGGGYRTVFAPSVELKRIQRKVLRYLRTIGAPRYIVMNSPASTSGSYVAINGLTCGSYVEHAKAHSLSRWILKFDLKNAFPSTDIATLREVLFQRVYESTRNVSLTQHRTDLIIQLTILQGKLPQGAPTSPFLFSLILGDLFYRLSHCCTRGYRISCYVDGFVVSGPKPISPEVQTKMFQILRGFSFEINEKKTKLLDCRHGAVMVTGLRVNGKGRVSLPKKKIRQWRGFINTVANEIENNPRMDDELRKKMKRIDGFVASLKPVYGEILPPQIAIPYKYYQQAIKLRSSMPT